MKLSIKSCNLVSNLLKNIKSHPFIQELGEGTLAYDKFEYYLDQDSLYLKNYKRCSSFLAYRVPPEHQSFFLRSAPETINLEQAMQQSFSQIYDLKKSKKITPALFNHIPYLLDICSTHPPSIGMAAMFSCLKVYDEIGLHLHNTMPLKQRPFLFEQWIKHYNTEKHKASVNKATELFDLFADNATEITRNKMLETFYKSTQFELKFWDDVYNKRAVEEECLLLNDNVKINTFVRRASKR